MTGTAFVRVGSAQWSAAGHEDAYSSLSAMLEARAAVRAPVRSSDAAAWGVELNPAPYVIGVTGSVSVGKSATAELLAQRIGGWPTEPTVRVVSTDAFLLPNRELDARGLSMQKGFPVSYDHDALESFLVGLRSGLAPLHIPVYSHVRYDIVDGAEDVVERADVVIVEGLGLGSVGVHLDLLVYVDAEEPDIEQWFVDRFARLRTEHARDPDAFYRPFADMADAEVEDIARWTWREINAVNLHDHVLPGRDSADVVLHKDGGHRVVAVSLRTG